MTRRLRLSLSPSGHGLDVIIFAPQAIAFQPGEDGVLGSAARVVEDDVGVGGSNGYGQIRGRRSVSRLATRRRRSGPSQRGPPESDDSARHRRRPGHRSYPSGRCSGKGVRLGERQGVYQLIVAILSAVGEGDEALAEIDAGDRVPKLDPGALAQFVGKWDIATMAGVAHIVDVVGRCRRLLAIAILNGFDIRVEDALSDPLGCQVARVAGPIFAHIEG